MRLLLLSTMLAVSGWFCSSTVAQNPPACTGGETYSFEVQTSVDGGATWQSGDITLCNHPGYTVELAVRTRMTITSGQTEAWSFGLRHDDTFLQWYSGSATIDGVTTNGTDTATVQNGAPPDTDETDIITSSTGFTQGVVVDLGGGNTLAPTANFVTASACYTILVPPWEGQYPLTFSFVNDLGSPATPCIVTQDGQSNAACAKNVTVNINADYDVVPCTVYPPACTLSSNEKGGGAGLPPPQNTAGTDFRRADSNQDGTVDITDPIVTLGFLFLGNPAPGCLDAADSNDDEEVDLSDPVHTLSHLFLGGDAPPDPGTSTCGPDPTDETTIALDCQVYNACVQTDTDNDGLTDFFEGVIGTNPANDDTDGDNFSDGEEVLPTGVPGCNGGALNINTLGADPTVPDIFVEIDFMVQPGPGGHSHQPMNAALTLVVNAFAAQGIALHPDTGAAPFNLGGGNSLGHQAVMGFGQGNPDFAATKTQNFDNNNRCNVFHYNTWVHDHRPNSSSSGRAEIGGDDLIVSLGSWPNQNGTLLQQAGTFMHELGHNLNLRHGGNENRNRKPNYSSVMSYNYQTVGVDTNCDTVADGVIDYSGVALANLDENALDESVGVCNGVPIDWNGDGDTNDVNLSRNINCRDFVNQTSCADQTLNVLTGFDDWANIVLFMNSDQGGGAGQEEDEECMTLNDL